MFNKIIMNQLLTEEEVFILITTYNKAVTNKSATVNISHTRRRANSFRVSVPVLSLFEKGMVERTNRGAFLTKKGIYHARVLADFDKL